MQLKLNLQYFAGEKTEKATPKKREDERKKGKVGKSQDVNTAILLLFTFMILAFYGGTMKQHMLALYSYTFTEYIHWELTTDTIMLIFSEVIIEIAKAIGPVMIVALLAGVIANVLQIGLLFTTEPLKFDLKKIDPIQGAKRIFSIRALVELLKSLFKIVLIGAVTFTIILMYKDEMMMMAYKSADSALAFFGRVAITMALAATVALFFLAIFDYLYQRHDYEKNMKMSKQDIKDEYKNMDGDPLIKSKIKEKQRQMAMQRMMSEVPSADVVITNPTHYSIAIKYDESKASAPYIVAKGADLIAFKIREIAKAHNVVIVENKMLARSLYNVIEIGDVVPEDFYKAVAEVLAYVYRLEKKLE